MFTSIASSRRVVVKSRTPLSVEKSAYGPGNQGQLYYLLSACYSKSKSIIIEERRINTFVMIFTNLRAQFVPLYTTIHCVCMQSHSHVNVYLNRVNYES